MKFPKLKLPKKNKRNSKISKSGKAITNGSNFFGLLFTILVTSLLISAVLIAIPKTERFIPENRFDLNVKNDQYWSKNFILELRVDEEDSTSVSERVELTKAVIQRRLDRYNVESSSIRALEDYKPENDTSSISDEITLENLIEEEAVEGAADSEKESVKKYYLEVTAETSQDETFVTRLVGSRYFLSIMTPKPEALNSEDQLAQYLPTNYDETQFTRKSFRNIEIKELPTQNGQTAYFAIYKIWPQNALAWRGFLEDNAGKSIGLAIDGFVTPYQVPIEFNPALRNPQQNQIFAPAVTQDPEEAKVIDILYNSGIIPVEYSLIDSVDTEAKVYDIDYIEVSAAFIISTIIVMAYSYFRNRTRRGKSLVFMMTAVSTFALYISFLKITSYPVDLAILMIEGLSIILIAKVLTYRTRSLLLIDIPVIIFFGLLSLYGSGYLGFYGMHMVVLSVAIMLIIPVLDTYITKMRNLLLR